MVFKMDWSKFFIHSNEIARKNDGIKFILYTDTNHYVFLHQNQLLIHQKSYQVAQVNACQIYYSCRTEGGKNSLDYL